MAATAISIATVACGSKDVVDRGFIEPGTSRPYHVLSPSRLDPNKPVPILFVLHPFLTEPSVVPDAFSLKKNIVEKRGWVLVVPEGKRDDNGARFWNASSACCAKDATNPPDDLHYLRAILEDVKRHYPVDEKRTFAFGVSNGAFMAYRWACDAGGDLSAVVCIAGVGPGPNDPPCAPRRRVSVLHVHGDQDEVIRYLGKAEGKDAYPSAAENARTWARLDGLSEKPDVENEWIFLLGDIRKEIWRGDGAEVQLWTVLGGRHHMRWIRRVKSELLHFFDGI